MFFIDRRKQKHAKSSFLVFFPEWTLPQFDVMAFYDDYNTAMEDLFRHNEIDCKMPSAFLYRVDRSTIAALKRTKNDKLLMRKLSAEIKKQNCRERITPGIFFV